MDINTTTLKSIAIKFVCHFMGYKMPKFTKGYDGNIARRYCSQSLTSLAKTHKVGKNSVRPAR